MPKIENEHTDLYYLRVDQVVVLILSNERFLHSKRSKELTAIVKKKFGCEERTAEYYIADAKKVVRSIGKKNIEKSFRRAVRDREYVIAISKDKKDLRIALEAMKDRDKLCGLYIEETKQTGEMTVKNIDMSQFTEFGLEKLKRGEKLEDVLLDPKSLKQNVDINAISSRS